MSNNHQQQLEKNIFVTVGTTLFASLIDVMTQECTIERLIENGYTHLIVQYGQGTKPSLDSIVINSNNKKLYVELYDFKPSLYDDMVQADVIVCHAGAGTLIEALRISQQQQQQSSSISKNGKKKNTTKKVVTVVNTKLMDNHQTELAYALQRRQLVYVVDDPLEMVAPETLIWDQIESFQPAISSSDAALSLHGNPYDVPQILHNFFGFSTNKA
jgi:beta-1,4-N-acetylglucosaminyltransferase